MKKEDYIFLFGEEKATKEVFEYFKYLTNNINSYEDLMCFNYYKEKNRIYKIKYISGKIEIIITEDIIKIKSHNANFFIEPIVSFKINKKYFKKILKCIEEKRKSFKVKPAEVNDFFDKIQKEFNVYKQINRQTILNNIK